jgi:hypothetical protein
VPPDQLGRELARIAAREAAEIGDGKVAVIVPAARVGELGAAVAGVVAGTSVGAEAELENPVVVLRVRQAKGLEFDSVLIVEPEEILAESPRGYSDLYVGMTRATQRLGVLYTGEPPAVLDRLKDRTSDQPWT